MCVYVYVYIYTYNVGVWGFGLYGVRYPPGKVCRSGRAANLMTGGVDPWPARTSTQQHTLVVMHVGV